jgi:MFS family permease
MMALGPWKSRYTVLSVLFAAWIVSAIDKIAMSVAMPYVAADLELSPLAMGAVMSAFFISYSIAQIPGGILADRLGVRKVATAAMLWWSAFTAISGAATNMTQLISARFLFGLGEGIFPACGFKTIATWFPKKERATANAIMFSASFLGGAIAPLVVVAIISFWGWRPVFYSLLLPGVFMAFFFWKFIPNHPAQASRITAEELAEIADAESVADDEIVGDKKSYKEILLSVNGVQYFLVLFLFNLAYWGFTTWLPTYLVKARGFSMVEMGVIASLPFFAGTIGVILGGRMSDTYFRTSRRTPIIVSQLLSALLLYLTFTSASTTMLIVCQTSAGFFLMFFFGVFWALPMNTIPARYMGVTAGFVNMAGQIAAFTAPMVIGYLVGVSGGGFGSTFAFMIDALLLSCALVFTIPALPNDRTADLATA